MKKMTIGERVLWILKKLAIILLAILGVIILYDIFCAVNIFIKVGMILLGLFIYGVVTG